MSDGSARRRRWRPCNGCKGSHQASAQPVPEAIARAGRYKPDQAAPIATIDKLTGYDVIIVGPGTRHIRMASQMAKSREQPGELWLLNMLMKMRRRLL